MCQLPLNYSDLGETNGATVPVDEIPTALGLFAGGLNLFQ
jgi:hypothetical protein